VVVVSQRGPLLLVAVSSGGEPVSTLRRRLDLLHGQVWVPSATSGSFMALKFNSVMLRYTTRP
jgi:hypothetical protein